MSSAGVQAAPQSPSALSGGHHYSSSSAAGRDYYSPTSSQAPLPSTSPARRAAKRNGTSSSAHNSPQTPQHHDSPATIMSASASRARPSPGAAMSSPQQESTLFTQTSPLLPEALATSLSGTDATAHVNSSRSGGSARKNPSSSSSHHHQQQHSQSQAPGTPHSQHSMDRTREAAAAAPSSSSRRNRSHPSSSEAVAYGRSPNQTQLSQQSQQHRDVAQRPEPPSREESHIINRLVIDDPAEDVIREQQRVQESVPIQDQPQHQRGHSVGGALGLVPAEGVDDGARVGSRSRHDYSKSSRKETRFANYILGQTLGEGEFGKVKMGWKREGGAQVAIKLMRRENLTQNPSRLPKIYREITILSELSHPNIVRLHEMVETDRHIGIVLEYASGGELFDYILNHRYLKDSSARRLFAQLVSGVGYLHKKGIVHRDLKLENLLLDRNRNIIITDFGFANTFNPADELGEDVEERLHDKEFVRSHNLDHVAATGLRRGDLMQTSCGSPCYAAPELVVSDSLYTGRKVDVWSCGVILYAMLAGYLPFDDDPANPEGDNINLLYKYIVTTTLTFPDYVTPHARDLLRRILVPDPRKRADLFEVARHSWLTEYAHVVGFITSTTTTSSDIGITTVPSEEPYDKPTLGRSASVREPTKAHTPVATVGGLQSQRNRDIDPERTDPRAAPRDAKRRTVQVEYVAPPSQTTRAEAATAEAATSPQAPSSAGRSRPRQEPQVSAADNQPSPYRSSHATREQQQQPSSRNGVSSAERSSMAPPVRPGREPPRSVSDSTGAFGMPSAGPVSPPGSRPATSGTIGSNMRLPSRGNSYGLPAVATVDARNAQGRISQPPPPKSGTQGYVISGPIPQNDPMYGDFTPSRPATQGNTPAAASPPPGGRTHKRSNTLGELGSKLFGRSGSILGRSPSQPNAAEDGSTHTRAKVRKDRAHPPTAMSNAMSNDNNNGGSYGAGRKSGDSFRRTSFGFARRMNDTTSPDRSAKAANRSSRRFSFLPAAITGRKNSTAPSSEGYANSMSASPNEKRRSTSGVPTTAQSQRSRPSGMAFGQGASRSPSQSTLGSAMPHDPNLDPAYSQNPGMSSRGPQPPMRNYPPTTGGMYASTAQQYSGRANKAPTGSYNNPQSSDGYGSSHQRQDSSSLPPQPPSPYHPSDPFFNATQQQPTQPPLPTSRGNANATSDPYASHSGSIQRNPNTNFVGGNNGYDMTTSITGGSSSGATALLGRTKKFSDAYDAEPGRHEGSSGAARKVMDFFRRSGKARANADGQQSRGASRG